MNAIRQIPEKGYSCQENDVKNGQTCLVAPVFNKTGNMIAVLSIRMANTKMNKFHIEQVIGDITSIAAILTEHCRKI